MEIIPFDHNISQQIRQSINGHRPVVLWFTGLSGSGKSTIAANLENLLVKKYSAHTCFLDGDSLRLGLNSDLGFTEQDRSENVRRVGEVARLMYDAGLICLVCLISPFIADREKARSLIPEDGFIEIFVDCPLDVCEKRDPKKLYKRTRTGDLQQFTGITSRYEVPSNPDVILHTDTLDITDCVDVLVKMLERRGIFN